MTQSHSRVRARVANVHVTLVAGASPLVNHLLLGKNAVQILLIVGSLAAIRYVSGHTGEWQFRAKRNTEIRGTTTIVRLDQ